MNTGWILVLGSVLLLVTLNKVDLLVILFPLALLLAFVAECPRHDKTGLTGNIKKG